MQPKLSLYRYSSSQEPRYKIEESFQVHDLREKTSRYLLKRKLGGPTAGMDALEYWKISGLWRKSNHDSSVVHSLD